MDEYAIGIDLGTTHCCVAVYKNGRTEVFENDHGTRTTPSYVAFTDRERFVGNEAKSHAAVDPSNTVFDSKRLLGRPFNDIYVQKDIKHWPFSVRNENEKPKIYVKHKNREVSFIPEEISAMILTKMKQIAEDKLDKVTGAVITVPAYFNDRQRQATKDAARIAGLNVLRLINEPTAAAVAFALDKKGEQKLNVLVYDLGGGTFDVSVLTIDNGIITVRAVNGDTHLGGNDFDNLLVDYFLDEIKIKSGKDLRKNKYAVSKLTQACETAKKSLSGRLDARIEINSLFEGKDYKTSITRAKFEELCDQLLRQTLDPVKEALKDAKLSKSEIDEILLVGGSTRIPKVQSLLKEYFNEKRLNKSINPDEAVAVGAAIQAACLKGDPDELIASLSLKDVTPLSYGIAVLGEIFSVIVPRNTPYPTRKYDIFQTMYDFQTHVKISVYQGERALTKENELIGEFTLSGLPLRWGRGVNFEVIIEIDANGILDVSAVERSTGLQRKITITNAGKLSDVEINQMIKEAEKFKKDDERVKEVIVSKNELTKMAFDLRRLVVDFHPIMNFSQDTATNIIKKSDEIVKWLKDHPHADIIAINKKIDELKKLDLMVSLDGPDID